MELYALDEIGMTYGEKKVYLSLLDLGESTTGQIISNSGITSSKVYLILEKLENKGLVSHVVKNNIKYFQVANPERILDYLEEKKKKIDKDKEEIEKILPFLKSKLAQKTPQETKMYHGYQGLKSALAEFIKDLKEGEEYVVFGSQGHFGEMYENFIKNFYIEKERKKIKTRLIYNSSFKEIKRLYKGLNLTKIKFIDFITPSTIAISNKKILISSYGESAMQVVIINEAIAKSFYTFFESMWKIAKP